MSAIELSDGEMAMRIEFYQECERRVKAIYEAKLKALEQKYEALTKKHDLLKDNHLETHTLSNQQKSDLANLTDRQQKLDKAKTEAEKNAGKFQRKVETLEASLAESKKVAAQSQSELKRLKHMEPDKLAKKVSTLSADLKKIKKQSADASQQARVRKKELDEVNRQIKTLGAENEKLKAASEKPDNDSNKESKEELAEAV